MLRLVVDRNPLGSGVAQLHRAELLQRGTYFVCDAVDGLGNISQLPVVDNPLTSPIVLLFLLIPTHPSTCLVFADSGTALRETLQGCGCRDAAQRLRIVRLGWAVHCRGAAV